MATYTDVCYGKVWDDDYLQLIAEVEYWKEQGKEIEFYITKRIEVPDDKLHFGDDAGRTLATYVVKADRQLWRRICTIVDIEIG